MDDQLTAFVAGMPKAELHVHIEGTLEPELRMRLAARNGVTLPHQDIAAIRATYTFTDLASFLTVYYDAMRVLLTEDDFYDLAYAYLSKAAGQQVRYVEMFFDPQAHTQRAVSFGTVVRGLRRAIVDARRDLGITGELILCFLRDLDPRWAMATLMESLPYRDWIIGVGLDSDERGNPPALFAEVFARARSLGYFLTMHCDIDQENTHEHIRQALEDIGVDRIDHGSNAAEVPALVSGLLARRVGLTCCPVSNSFVTKEIKAGSMRQLFDAGVKVTVNSDDPAYFGGYISENLVAAGDAMAMSRAELLALQRNAFDIAWLPAARRDGFLAELDAYAK